MALLRNPILAEQWFLTQPLPDFSTGGLARHLANQVTLTVTFLAAPGRRIGDLGVSNIPAAKLADCPSDEPLWCRV
ncbi:hypothetical protein LUPAC06_05396 [Micromonospora saelicesensis]|uniref:hypothetical protein n=1 Tax=Micromonospora saelicesensis TaxID=285676 RepID=UPI000DC03995|nr:hypothetical protein [Micromonospora saelicesensis]RAO53526.1 hypothetical protein LUPAC06_05396 [Micromonospora saelicesensis]